MPHNAVGWFEIYVADMDRAKKFYEAVFEVQLTNLPSPAGELELWAFPMQREGMGASGALVKMEGGPSGGNNSVIVYFMSKDCAVEQGRVEANGGQVMKPKFSIGQYGFITLVTDTESNVIGVHSMS